MDNITMYDITTGWVLTYQLLIYISVQSCAEDIVKVLQDLVN